MVLLLEGYCIDATEVTRGQYQNWLSDNPSILDQDEVCEWNDSFGIDPECNSDLGDNYPVSCVDWCDAYAYCEAMNKRLCGKIRGGSNAEPGNAATNQWYAACSSGGQNAYPYGDLYDSGRCNGGDSGIGRLWEVKSKDTCQSPEGGYKGVYDLSGNVWEWEDSCSGTAGPSDNCHARGGAYANSSFDLRCEGDRSQLRNLFSSTRR